MRSRHFPLWTLLGVVLVVALLIGGGVFSSSPPTNAQRAAAIESVIRCPSCEDLSVAVSTAPTAVTVRATVRQLVDQGRSDQQIKDYLAARYGSAIVLEPPTSGWSALVWALPIAAGLAGLAVLVVVLVRRRRRGPGDLDADVRGPMVDPAVLEERRRFLTQSLADADAEYLAGDLSDADYLGLRQRDLARLAALGDADPPTDDPGTGPGIAAPAVPAPGRDRRSVRPRDRPPPRCWSTVRRRAWRRRRRRRPGAGAGTGGSSSGPSAVSRPPSSSPCRSSRPGACPARRRPDR